MSTERSALGLFARLFGSLAVSAVGVTLTLLCIAVILAGVVVGWPLEYVVLAFFVMLGVPAATLTAVKLILG